MPELDRRPTMRDVAVRAGVSVATVSRILARPDADGRGETATRVRLAAEEVGYSRSSTGASAPRSRSQVIGVIGANVRNPFFADLVDAIGRASLARGYTAIDVIDSSDRHDPVGSLRFAIQHHLDGVIVASGLLSDEGWRLLAEGPLPAVVVDAAPPGSTLSTVASDNVEGSHRLVEHLISLGHRRIAYVRGEVAYFADAQRIEGFARACIAAGIPRDWCPILPGDGTVQSGELAAQQVLATYRDATAIICHNDLVAIGVLRHMRSAGVLVPDDISIAGCDDIRAASWIEPPLTTLAQDPARLAELAVARLDEVIREPATRRVAVHVRIAMSLRVRDSTGPVRTDSHRPVAVSA